MNSKKKSFHDIPEKQEKKQDHQQVHQEKNRFLQRRSSLPMSESFLLGALLTVVGGYFDVYTYITRGGVFANAQTGNIVLLGINLADGDILQALSHLIPILAFVLGVFTAEFLHKRDRTFPVHWRQAVIALEIITVAIVGFMPTSDSRWDTCNMIANVIISYVCSLQVQSFRKVHGIVCATTMCTGNLRSGTDQLIQYKSTGQKQHLKDGLKYYAINLFFIVGAIIGVYAARFFGGYSILFCLIPLFFVFLLMFLTERFPQSH